MWFLLTDTCLCGSLMYLFSLGAGSQLLFFTHLGNEEAVHSRSGIFRKTKKNKSQTDMGSFTVIASCHKTVKTDG